MRFLTPVEITRLADVIRPRYRALVLVGAYGGLRIGELAGLRRERVDPLRGTVEVAEIMTEVAGKLQVGPPKTRASRRTIGLPRAVVNVLAEHLARVASQQTSCSPAHRAIHCGSQTSVTASGARQPQRPPWTDYASTTFATPPWPCGSRPEPVPRRSPCGRDTPR
jgi:integrase